MNFDRYPPQIMGFGAIFVLLLLYTIFIVVGYNQGVLQNESTQIYLQAGGVLATILLIGIYLLLIFRERRESEDERLRWLFADVISNVIDPARERAIENRHQLQSGQFDWTLANPLDELSTLSRDLGAESTHIERFKEHFPDLYEDLEYHDNELRGELVRTGQNIRNEVKEPLADYFNRNPVAFTGTDEELAIRMLSIHLNDDFYMTNPTRDTEYSYYLQNSEQINDLIEDAVEVKFNEYNKLRKDYIEFCTSIYERLGEARDEIRQDFPIPSGQLSDST